MYYLYKLKFPNGIHIGTDKPGVGLEKVSLTCHSDTFFSAICLEILKLFGKDSLNEFVSMAKSGEVLFSDLMPFKDTELYIPKPVIYVERNKSKKNLSDSSLKKKFKKLQYIPITKIDDYCEFLKTGDTFPEYDTDFGENAVYEKASITRAETGDKDLDKNKLFSVGAYHFHKDSGLYFIIKCPEDKIEWFEKVLKSLAFSGIGGKRTSGYGRFDFYEDRIEIDEEMPVYDSDEILARMLNKKADYYLTLSILSPKPEEINIVKDGYYSLVTRQGFVASADYSETFLKKTPVTMINAGSCFKEKLQGQILDVSNNGNHPVYRYGKPIAIGVNL